MDKVNEKKPYTPPQVIEYGSLAEITRTAGNDGDDGAQVGSQETN